MREVLKMINVVYKNKNDVTVAKEAKRVMSKKNLVLVDFGKKVAYYELPLGTSGSSDVNDAVENSNLILTCQPGVICTSWKKLEKEAVSKMQDYYKSNKDALQAQMIANDDLTEELLMMLDADDIKALYHWDYPEYISRTLDELFQTQKFTEIVDETIWGLFC